MFAGYRLNNFVVGLQDMSTAVKPPRLWDYDVCGQWPGVVGNGVTIHLRCTDSVPPRQYVIVQSPHATALDVCEIQVYPRRTFT